MKCFHTTNYKIYNNIKNDIKVLLLSDIHFSKKVKNKKLDMITKYINRIKPNYILISGDIVDSVDIINNLIEKERLVNWIKNISSNRKVIISLGNHELYKNKYNDSRYIWEENYDLSFFESLNNFDNIYVLNNNKYEDEYIYVVGITNSFTYYIDEKNNYDIFMNELYNVESICKNLDNNKIKFVLIHTPLFLCNKEVVDFLSEFDYFVSGHMHNGCVPPILYEIWKSDRGIVSPGFSFFNHNERNILKYKKDKLIVNGAVTTFHECAGIFEKFNFLFPIYNIVLDFTNNKIYNGDKLKCTRKYHK